MSNYFTKEELSQLQKYAFTDEQCLLINEPTPEDSIVYLEESKQYNKTETKAPEKNDNPIKYKSVKGSYVKKRLNLIFGFKWNFEVLREFQNIKTQEIIVLGKLSIPTKDGFTITREQFGKYKFQRDIGDGYKSATTDSLKKCASEFGICWDIYDQEKEEAKPKAIDLLPEETHQQNILTKKLEVFLKKTNSIEDIEKIVFNFESNAKISPRQLHLIEQYKEKY